MVTYKGTDRNMKCYGGFQYVLGKEYVSNGAVRCGDNGFHSCMVPLDVLQYFSPSTGSRYFVCEADGEISDGREDSKIASSKLTLIKEMTYQELIKAQILQKQDGIGM